MADYSPSPYRVRPAVRRDLHQLADILASSFYGDPGWQSWIYPLLRIGIYEDLKQRFRHAPPHYVCLVSVATATASQEDWVVGTVELAPKGDLPWRERTKRQLYVSNLAVRGTHRRTGVARQLLRACEQAARADGFTELCLHVMEDNQPARRLYGQTGYHLEQAEVSFLTLLGQPRRLRLRKVLSDVASGVS